MCRQFEFSGASGSSSASSCAIPANRSGSDGGAGLVSIARSTMAPAVMAKMSVKITLVVRDPVIPAALQVPAKMVTSSVYDSSLIVKVQVSSRGKDEEIEIFLSTGEEDSGRLR